MSLSVTCQISGEQFLVSDHEMKLREQFWFTDLPTVMPSYRLQLLWAFYPNWSFYNRTCDKTWKSLVSVFPQDCQYPVWDRKEWFSSAQPPWAPIDFDRPFFDQAREVFYQSPIPHIFQYKCENCEYTDDWYESRDCYLCHGWDNSEGVRYSANVNTSKDCMQCVLIDKCEKCYDCVNCISAYSCVACLDVRNSSNCTLCYDMRNCQDCIFCYNQRWKQYCIGNKQLTKDQYEQEKNKWQIESRDWYAKAQNYFKKMMHEIAWLRSSYVEHSENTTWNYISHMKDCEMCFMQLYHENCCHDFWAGWDAKHICEWVGTYGCQGWYKVAVPIKCFEMRMSFMTIECRFSDYTGYSVGCENCFWCCGMHKEKFCVLNTPYSKNEYDTVIDKLIDHMKSTGEWGNFFPGNFAPNSYTDSLSGYFFPLSDWEKQKFWFNVSQQKNQKISSYQSSLNVPQTAHMADEDTTKLVFWDEQIEKPFTILGQDINFCRELKVPLPDTFYLRRIFWNLSWMPFDGELRKAYCAKSGKEIQTSWPAEYDGRILSEEEYLKIVQ